MKTFKLINGDLSIKNNNFELIDSNEDIVQGVERIISTRLGEWFLNQEFGLNYDNITQKNYDEDLVRLDFIEALSLDPRFEELLEFEIIQKPNRVGEIKFKARVSGIEVQEVINFA